jgi:hypothetical protein
MNEKNLLESISESANDELWLRTDWSFRRGGDKHPHIREIRILYDVP